MDLVTARYKHARRPKSSALQDDAFPLGGGLNLVDSPLNVRPGELLAVKNYEPAPTGIGYRRILGYERYARGFRPSEGRYTILNYHRATLQPQIDNAIVGSASAASGQVIDVVVTKPITVINLAPHSEAFDEAGTWTLDDLTLALSGIENPVNGELTAQRLVETTAITDHAVRTTIVKPSEARMYWVSVYVRPFGNAAAVTLRAFNNVSFAQAVFFFNAAAVYPVTDNGDFVGLGQYMMALPNGWWRIGIKFVASVQPALTSQLMMSTPGGEVVYSGNPTDGVEVFGHQIEETTLDSVEPGEYVQTDSIPRGNGEGQLALMQLLTLTGDYVDAENLHVEGVVHAEANGPSTVGAADTDELDSQYRAASRAKSREHAVQVPGSGPVRGVAIYNGRAYALRDNEDGTAGVLWRANDGTGWTAVPLGEKLHFDGGKAPGIFAGNTLTGQTTGASGVVLRVVVQRGSFDTNDAEGYVIFASTTDDFLDDEPLLVSATEVATAHSTQFPQTLAPGGYLRTRIHNFFGHASTLRLYGVDGVNPAWEYEDSSFFNLIETGMPVDKPKHIAIYSDQLWLGFSGGSLQRSAVGEPASWSVSLGAAEMAVGSEIVGLLEEIGDVLFVFTRNRTHYVAGDNTNQILKVFSSETGAHENTVQRIGQGVFLDDRGLTSVTASDRHGNFASNSFSAKAEPLVKELRRTGAISSCVIKDKNIYRVFFADGRFLSVGINGNKITGITTGDLGIPVRAVDSGEDENGNELIVFSSDDGYVYRMESGPSFDGLPLQAFFRTAFHHSRTPQHRKRYRRAALHVEARGACTLYVGTDYSFADPGEAIEAIRNLSLSGGGGIWNVSLWNSFRWSAGVIADASIKLDASGTNIGFLVSHEADDEDEHTVSSVMIALSQRRRNRGVSHG